jgi:hypothetical protein
MGSMWAGLLASSRNELASYDFNGFHELRYPPFSSSAIDLTLAQLTEELFFLFYLIDGILIILH